MDRTGKRRVLARVPWELRWSPRGDEIWFTEIQEGATSIAAVNLSGRKRILASFPGIFGLQDVSRDGRVLLEQVSEQIEAIGRFPGESGERHLSWLDRSVPAALSDDGKTLLFTETGQGGGANHAVYKRNTDGSDAVRLGDGAALALSPDGRWALSSPGPKATHLVLLPTGAGQARELPLPGIQLFGKADFLPDGNQVLVRGREPGHGMRLYLLDVRSGKGRPITAEGVSGAVSVSPDGKLVLSSTFDGKNFFYDLEGGTPRAVTAIPKEYRAIRWCADGRSLFVETGRNPVKVSRLELSSGRLDPWKEFSVSDMRSGSVTMIPTPDGKSYVYSYSRYFSDLFLAEGLK